MLHLLLSLLLIIINPSSAFAQNLSGTPAPESDEVFPTGQVLSDEIQKIRRAVQDKVTEKLKAITSSTNPNKGWAGSITIIENDKITINFLNNEKILFFTADTIIVDDKRKKISSGNLKVGQNIVGMGKINEDGTLDTKRIISYDPKTLVKKQIVIGKIADISKASPIFVIIPANNKDIQYQTKTDTKTLITDKSSTKIDFKTLAPGQKIIAILVQDPKNLKSYTATHIISLAEASSPTPTPKAAN